MKILKNKQYRFEVLDLKIYIRLSYWLIDAGFWDLRNAMYQKEDLDVEKYKNLVDYVNTNYAKYVRNYSKQKPKKNVVRKFLRDKNIYFFEVINGYGVPTKVYDLKSNK